MASKFIHIYPNLSKFIQIYPNLSKFIQMYPNLSKFIQIIWKLNFLCRFSILNNYPCDKMSTKYKLNLKIKPFKFFKNIIKSKDLYYAHLKNGTYVTDGGKATNTHFTSVPQIKSQNAGIAACAYRPTRTSFPVRQKVFTCIQWNP